MALVEIVGQGYVGLSTLIAISESSAHKVVGVEYDDDRLNALRNGRPPFSEPGLRQCVQALAAKDSVTFEGRDYHSDEPAVLIIAVPAPTDPSGRVDTSTLETVMNQHYDCRWHDLVLVRTTLLPGTSQQLIRDARWPNLGEAYCYWPEFLNQGRALAEVRSPDRVILGCKSVTAWWASVEFLHSVGYQPWSKYTLEEAECVKHFSNMFLAVNRVLAADVAMACQFLAADASRVLAGVAADRRLSSELLRAVPALTDSCLRKDLFALSEALDGAMPIASIALDRSHRQHQRFVDQVMRHALSMDRWPKILIIGMGFEPSVGDVQDSLAWSLIPRFGNRQASIWDPYADRVEALPVNVHRADDLPSALDVAELVVLLVEHPEVNDVDWQAVADRLERPGGAIFDATDSIRLRDVNSSRGTVHRFGAIGRCTKCAG